MTRSPKSPLTHQVIARTVKEASPITLKHNRNCSITFDERSFLCLRELRRCNTMRYMSKHIITRKVAIVKPIMIRFTLDTFDRPVHSPRRIDALGLPSSQCQLSSDTFSVLSKNVSQQLDSFTSLVTHFASFVKSSKIIATTSSQGWPIIHLRRIRRSP